MRWLSIWLKLNQNFMPTLKLSRLQNVKFFLFSDSNRKLVKKIEKPCLKRPIKFENLEEIPKRIVYGTWPPNPLNCQLWVSFILARFIFIWSYSCSVQQMLKVVTIQMCISVLSLLQKMLWIIVWANEFFTVLYSHAYRFFSPELSVGRSFCYRYL